MATPTNYLGDLRRLSVVFTDLAGATLDPTAVSLTVTEPDGTTTVKTLADGVVNDPGAGGALYYDFSIAKAGRHTVRWAGTGALQAAGASEFYALRKETL